MIRFQSLTNSFMLELLQAIHDFDNDVFNLALYTSAAVLDESATAYTATDEVVGAGYAAGGQALTNVGVVFSGGVSYPDFEDEVFSAVTLPDIRMGLIYNASKANRSVVVLDFGRSIAKTAQDFTVRFPEANPTSAIIRLRRA